MVNYSFFALLATLAPLAANAMPASPSLLSDFSIESWANEIVSNPTGNHLSPEDALAAITKHANTGRSVFLRADGDISCNHLPGEETNAPDAVRAIDALASRGSQSCDTIVGKNKILIIKGDAKIMAVTNKSKPVKATCGEMAIMAGKMMDKCYRSDNTIQAIAYPKDGYALHILSKKK